MNVTTGIGWTDATSNPLKYRDKATGETVWACVKASPGCKNCYAEALTLRYGRGGEFAPSNIDSVEPYLCEKELGQILRSKKIAGKRVFIEDMSDLFGPWVPDGIIDAVFAVMFRRKDVTFQVLTKRADRMAAYLTDPSLSQRLHETIKHAMGYHHPDRPAVNSFDLPLPNVLVGFSAENQSWFDRRAVHVAQLVRTGWRVWVSAEPLLGSIDPTRVKVPVPPKTQTISTVAPAFREWATANGIPTTREVPDGLRPIHGRVCELNALTGATITESGIGFSGSRGLSWGVVGGESGRGHRACEPGWVADFASHFRAAGVPVYVKQDSGPRPGQQGRLPLAVWEAKQHPEEAARG